MSKIEIFNEPILVRSKDFFRFIGELHHTITEDVTEVTAVRLN